MKNENLMIGAAYVLICILWGSTWLVIKIGLQSMTPLFSSGVRFIFASMFVFAVMRFRGLKIQRDSESIRLYLLIGLLSFVFPFALVYWGQQYVASGLGSILFAIFPFFVLIFSWILIPAEKVGPYKLLGIIVGFSGIVIIFSENIKIDLSSDFYGMVAIICSAVLQGLAAVLVKKYGRHLNPLSMNLVPLMIAGSILTLGSFVFEDTSRISINTEAVFSVLYLAFFGTLMTFTTYYWLMQRINVVLLSLSAFITPIIAVIFGFIFLNEILTTRDYIGSSLVLIGILFANFKGLAKYLKSKKQQVSNA